VYAKITKDLLCDGDVITVNREGHTWGELELKGGVVLHKIRLLDDDRIPYYEGIATDDALETVFEFAMHDVGCTILQVKDLAGEWIDAIS
jgi:hypothetical protein